MDESTPTQRTTPAEDVSTVGALVVRRGAGLEPGRVVGLVAHDLTIGRGDDCDVVLDSPHVSRHHARVRIEGTLVVLQDEESSNGTFVDGVRLRQPRRLLGGEVITLGDVELEFRSAAGTAPLVLPRRPTDPSTAADNVTQPLPPSGAPATASTKGKEATTLVLSVAAAGACTLISQALGSGRWGALASAMGGPLITAAFTLRDGKRIRVVPVAVVTALAVVLTVGGVSVADVVAGHSVIPGADRSGTFPGVGVRSASAPSSTPAPAGPNSAATSTTAAPPPQRSATGVALVVDPATSSCPNTAAGSRSDCAGLVVRSTGTQPLTVTGVDLEGANATAFAVTSGCSAPLPPGASCSIGVSFSPTNVGALRATVVIHQNLPAPDTGTRVAVTGQGTPGPSRSDGPPPVACGFFPQLSLSPDSGSLPATVTVTGTCFPAGGTVAVDVFQKQLVEATADGNGSFTATVTLDDSLICPQQQCTVDATQVNGAKSASRVFTITP